MKGMRVIRGSIAASAVLVVAAFGASAHSAPAAKKDRLVAFGSCGQLLGYAKEQASKLVSPWGFGPGAVVRGGVPAPAATGAREKGTAPKQGVDFSGTNVQEDGVDEPDIVKTDGETVFAASNGVLSAVDVRKHRPRLLDTLELDTGWSHELLLHGSRLLVLSRGGYWAEPLPAVAALKGPFVPSQSVITEVDVSNPSALRVARTLTLDGAYVSARLVGASARIVTSSPIPQRLPFVTPRGGAKPDLASARERNRAVVSSSRLAAWLPHYKLTQRGKATKTRALVQCRDVSRPGAFSGLGMLTVLTVDLAKGLEPVDSTAVMTDGRIVYASPDHLYVATERWSERPDPAKPTQAKNGVTTAIHDFDISSPTRTRYLGSGEVSGFLLSQWSLSEQRGVLRVVSTETPAWWGGGDESESFLTTLRSGGGGLVQAGRIGGLGKGERVYSVRFAGDVAYVVTFRQVDPLYTVDLSDASRPRILGELKIEGYSSYLHPIGDDLLLGVGQDATEQGRPTGTQLSLFDVSDLRQPKRLDHAPLGPGWSEAESDHHAFLYWPRTGLVVVPFVQQAAGFRVGRARGIDAVARVVHDVPSATIRRSLVVGDSVLTVSDAGVKSSSLATLADQGWAAFPPVRRDMPGPPRR